MIPRAFGKRRRLAIKKGRPDRTTALAISFREAPPPGSPYFAINGRCSNVFAASPMTNISVSLLGR